MRIHFHFHFHFSSLCCAMNFILISCTERMAKRMQEPKEENRIVANSRPTAMNLTSSVPTRSSSVHSPIASRSPVILKPSSRQVGLSGEHGASTNQNSNPDAPSSSQGWQRSISTGGLVATGYQGYPENPETKGSEIRRSILATSFPKITRQR